MTGGPRPDLSGQLGLPTENGHGLFDVLESWVEEGTPPPEGIATKRGQ